MTLKLGWVFAAVVAMAFLACPVFAQDDPASTEALRTVSNSGSPIDWTHFHVVFSSGSGDRSLQSTLQREPRYWLQLSRRQGSQVAGSSETLDAVRIASGQLSRQLKQKSPQDDPAARSIGDPDESDFESARFGFGDRDPGRLRRDWSQTFQTGGTVYTFNSPTYPAKFSFSGPSLSPSCTADYVVFTLPTGGAAPGNFDIIAYNNLYVSATAGPAFCSGGAPQAIFEYNASTANGTLNGSPALSLDGTLIAFIENAIALSGGAVFHVLKWHSGDTQKVDTLFPQAFNASTLASCAANGAAAPCEYNLKYTSGGFGSGKAATLSSPFVDYTKDIAYVSDDAGNVYAIAPVFTATSANPPKLVSGWPINVGASVVLTPPVYDSVSQNVFVADSVGTEFFIMTSGSTTGTCSTGTPPCLGSNTFAFTGGGTVFESPIVDSSTGKVFLFGTQTGGTSGSYIVQTDSALTAGSVQAAQIGTGTLNAIKSGTPDNNYFNSVATGKLYACGQNTSGEGLLYAFAFNASGVISTTPVTGSPFALGQASNSDAFCSAGLTENFNQSSGIDWLFAGVANRCVNTLFGGNGCVLSFDVTNTFPTAVASQIAVGGNPQLTGPSGMIVDNGTDAASTTITTDIYFIFPGARSCPDYLGSTHSGTCAGSATQSGLN
jgi:hypothetical protein